MRVAIQLPRTIASVAALLVGLGVALAAPARAASAQGVSHDTAAARPTDPERAARLKRQGAALRAGTWRLHDAHVTAGASASETPVVEGYFEKGLDLHLTLENTLGAWSRAERATTSGGLSGPTEETVRTMIVPMFSALKMYPFTRPEQRLEPYADAGVGVAFGIEKRDTQSGSILASEFGGSGSNVSVGYGFKGGVGVDWRPGTAFGLSVGGRYQWVRFDQPVGGAQLYRGVVIDGGLTYRFQY